ncbi:MAG TPA: dehydrogenase [Armatimonadetes bacterium]|jgi:predicted dehydrogenase|nr:dehydrogenase [Armatimonadota bacterium]
MSTLNIGFVGVGSMGQCAHLRNYVTIPGVQVVAIAELREKLREDVARRYGVQKTYTSAAEMLEAEQLDAIVASQPFTRHGVILPELLDAGVPVFIEKPLASSVQVGERLVAAVEASDTWAMVGYHKRSDPATMLAKAEIDRLKQTGELGAMRYVRITMPTGDWIAGGFADLVQSDDPLPHLETDPPASDMDETAHAEYVSFVNYYIHQVNLLRHLLGEPYGVSFADPAGVLLVAESESGVTGIIEMDPYSTSIGWEESALVCFEHGYVKLELPAPLANNRPGQVELLRDPGGEATPKRTIPALSWVHAMRQQAVNFVCAVKGETEPICDAAEALEDLRIAREYIRLLRGQ